MKYRFTTFFTLVAACCPPQARTSTPISSGDGDGAGTADGDGAGPVGPVDVTPPPSYDQIARLDFNRRAAELALPLFWRTDADKDGALDPDELATLWGWDGPAYETLVANGSFTPAFATLYGTMLKPASMSGLDDVEKRRRTLVLEELAQGRPTLVETDLTGASAEDRAIVDHVARAAVIVERIFARQSGVLGYQSAVAAADPASRMMFFRNQGPFCEAPRTEGEVACTALPSRPPGISGLYPEALQKDPKFCDAIAKAPNAAELMGHFSVVVPGATAGTWAARPYHQAYREDTQAVAAELEAAAAAIKSAEEQPFAAYLRAAAKAFTTDDWESADQAWLDMGNKGSKWYLRIGPDEVYHDPCALKAGFHVSFARINPDSMAWRAKLEPVKADMEGALAKLAGAPYKARKVNFKLPDFIDIVINAGNSRDSHGATIGQSLPNWGKVAEAGGRTVAMTNLYTDADSADALLAQTAALFCPATQQRVDAGPEAALMSIVLHEAAHNLGPAHDYKVKGKSDDEIFGGPLASTMEELKAQTAALYFEGWLAARGVITKEEADNARVRDVAWAFGHISRGMYTSAGIPKNYSQLASIQMGAFVKEKVLVWNADAMAANGTDKGCFEIDLVKWGPAADKLMARVAKAKGKGDKADAQAMIRDFVDAKDQWADLRGVITERWLRAPKASFVYSIKK
jgi:hypothetical protein